MTFYEQIVNEVQMSNYSRYYNVYASGRTVVPLTKKEPLPYEEQIQDFVQKVKDADCVIVGGASGLSAAGGGDFYYEDNASYRKYFGKYAEKYGFKGAFAGAFAHWVPVRSSGDIWQHSCIPPSMRRFGSRTWIWMRSSRIKNSLY